MRNSVFLNSIRFIGFIALQVFILNNINFLGYVNPYLYIFFILFLPVGMEQWKVLLLSFFLGLIVDVFSDSGGLHATACLAIGYMRPFFLRTAFGLSYDNDNINFFKAHFNERFTYIGLMVLFHHIVLFSLVFFDFYHLALVLKNAFFSGIFTILLILITLLLLQRSKGKRNA